jgi:hypothetical protein
MAVAEGPVEVRALQVVTIWLSSTDRYMKDEGVGQKQDRSKDHDDECCDGCASGFL